MPENDRAITPMPHELWHQANGEFPDDETKRRERYLTLMVEHGHLVIEKPPVEPITLDDPPPHINRAMHSCWRKEP